MTLGIDKLLTIDRIFIFLLVSEPVSFFWDRRISSIIALLLVITWLLKRDFVGLKGIFKNFPFIIFCLLFFIQVIGIFYSENKDFSLLERRLPLVLFPIIFYSARIPSKSIDLILYGFVLSCFTASAYVLIHTFLTNGTYDTEMTIRALNVSHVYFGFFSSFAIAILVNLLLTKIKRRILMIAVALLIALLLLFMFYVGGKMSIISLIVLILALGFSFSLRSGQRIKGVFLIALFLLISFFTLKSIENVRSRFSYLFNKEHYFIGNNAWSSIGVRLTIFTCARDVFKENVLIGTGLGDVQPDLNVCFNTKGFHTVVDMNAHNQYVQLLLGSGILGFGIFFLTFIVTIRRAIEMKDYLLLSFVFLFFMCCLTESLLERQQGVMFYAFFNSLLFFRTSDWAVFDSNQNNNDGT